MKNNVDNASPQFAPISFVNKQSKILENISGGLAKFRSKLLSIFSRVKRNSFNRTNFETSHRTEKSYKKYLPYAIIGVFVLLLLGILGSSVYFIFKNFPFGSSGISVLDAKARQELNREFSFPIYDASGKEVNKVKYTIQSAEFRDELIADGKRYKSVKGRTFLVLNLKLNNDFNQSITIDTKDYVRLSVGGKDEWVAADMHNDPLEVSAIATENTRLAFALNDTDDNLKLRIGEINGNKEEMALELK